MRLGAYIDEFSSAEAWAKRHVELGYGAAYWPRELVDYRSDEELIDEFHQAALRHGLTIAEVGAWNNLLDADPEIRRENMEYAIGQLRLAERVGARCVINISGSKNPKYWDGPDPENLSERTFDEIVDITQQIIDTAKPQNTYYTLEPMPWMIPYDVRTQARLIERVNRRHFGVHVDMCNMLNSMECIFNNGDVTREFFREFGSLIRSVHAKDSYINANELTLHICEAIPGQGMFDHEALLQCCDQLDRDLPVMAEHLSAQSEYLQATSFLKKKASELQLEFICGY